MIQGIDLCSIVQGRKCKLGEEIGIKQKKKEMAHFKHRKQKLFIQYKAVFNDLSLCVS